jgi:hypothetical protein
MIRLLTDFRKTALIAGIAIAVSALWSFFRFLLTGPHTSTSDFAGSITVFLVILLLELPLPVFLVLLYRTGIRPELSRNLRFVAAALVAVRCAAILFEVRDQWNAAILPVASHVASPGGTQSWFFLSPASHWWSSLLVISNVVNFGSRLAFVFFLVALARQNGPSQNADKHASSQVRNAALAAIFVGALSIVALLISFQVLAHAVRTYGAAGMTAPGMLSDLRRLLFALPSLIAPLIILVGVKVSRQC